MERELCVYEMSEAANPTSLARSRFLPERLPREYAATRARRAISLKAIRHSNDDLWSFVMLPDAPTVSSPPPPFLHSNGAVTIMDINDDQFVVNGQRLKVYYEPDVMPLHHVDVFTMEEEPERPA
jgi:hypothetical protein